MMYITTKIQNGLIYVVKPALVVKKGDKIDEQTALFLKQTEMACLQLRPTIKHILAGKKVYPVSMLELSQLQVLEKFTQGAANLLKLSLGSGYVN